MTIGALNTETVATHLKWVGNPSRRFSLLANDTGFTPTQASFPAALGGWASGSSGVARVPNGVYGFTSDASGNGVVGVSVKAVAPECTGSPTPVPECGGQTFGTGFGVAGEIPAGTDQNASAVYGSNSSSYAGPGPGAGGFGVFGLSAKGHGIVGVTGAVGAAGIIGTTNGAPGVCAGIFFGPVIVSGAFTVFGPKSAAVPHPDGTHRLLYCLESPESWFEDFGKGQLDCGQAEVAIDPNFAAIANMGGLPRVPDRIRPTQRRVCDAADAAGLPRQGEERRGQRHVLVADRREAERYRRRAAGPGHSAARAGHADTAEYARWVRDTR